MTIEAIKSRIYRRENKLSESDDKISIISSDIQKKGFMEEKHRREDDKTKDTE